LKNNKQLSKTFTIKNRLGLHARAAAVLVNDGKSILGILSFAASKGTNITVLTDGEDADIALNTIEELIESGFGEGV